jgi:hypothetical protein
MQRQAVDPEVKLFVYREEWTARHPTTYGHSLCSSNPTLLRLSYTRKETSGSHGLTTIDELTNDVKGLLGTLKEHHPLTRPEVVNGFLESCERIDGGNSSVRTPIPEEEIQKLWIEVQKAYPLA